MKVRNVNPMIKLFAVVIPLLLTACGDGTSNEITTEMESQNEEAPISIIFNTIEPDQTMSILNIAWAIDFDYKLSATRSHTNTIPQGIKLCGHLDHVVPKMGGFLNHMEGSNNLYSDEWNDGVTP